MSKLKIVTGEQCKGEAAFFHLTWKHAKLEVLPQEQRKEDTACSPGSQTGALACYSFLFILTRTSTAGYKKDQGRSIQDTADPSVWDGMPFEL